MKYNGALEAGGTKMVLAVMDENGNTLRQSSLPTKTPAETMPEMIAFFSAQPVSALGIGGFGPLNLDKTSAEYGYIMETPKLAWRHFPLVRFFQEKLGVPVGLDNDVNAAALAEARLGAAKGKESCLYVAVGTGIGGGMIIHGKTVQGLMHPEIGHISVSPMPDDPMPTGICPYHPHCLEGLASGPSIEKRWGVSALELLSEEDAAALRLPRLIDSRHVDGLILLGQPNKEYYRLVAGEGTPTVFLDFYDEQGSADSVVGDNTYGCYRLASHLIKNGHREIGFVGNVRATSSILDRFLGYYRALLLHDLPLNPEWIIKDRDDDNNWIDLTLPERLPTAFVCNCDVVAARLISLLQSRGLRVPQDISVTGFDDYLILPSDVPISTFRVDTDSMVELAVKTISERCSDSRKPFGRLVVCGQPVYRDSETQRSEENL